MNRARALKLAQEKWGHRAVARDAGRKASTKEHRESALRLLQQWREGKPIPMTLKWRERHDELLSMALSYRYSVGYLIGDADTGILGFSVQGCGDTWEEACRKAGLL
jgi:hypothetical protein